MRYAIKGCGTGNYLFTEQIELNFVLHYLYDYIRIRMLKKSVRNLVKLCLFRVVFVCKFPAIISRRLNFFLFVFITRKTQITCEKYIFGKRYVLFYVFFFCRTNNILF